MLHYNIHKTVNLTLLKTLFLGNIIKSQECQHDKKEKDKCYLIFPCLQLTCSS